MFGIIVGGADMAKNLLGGLFGNRQSGGCCGGGRRGGPLKQIVKLLQKILAKLGGGKQKMGGGCGCCGGACNSNPFGQGGGFFGVFGALNQGRGFGF